MQGAYFNWNCSDLELCRSLEVEILDVGLDGGLVALVCVCVAVRVWLVYPSEITNTTHLEKARV